MRSWHPFLPQTRLSTGNATEPSSAGARKTSGPQAIGITRGGLNTKIHAVCDALGNPLRFVLTPGQRHDSKAVPELLDGLAAKALLADKAYDSDKIVQSAQAQGMQLIIPSRVSRKKPRVLDKHRYKARHLVENLFQRMKVFRRVATRFDKLDIRFLGFVHIAGIMTWLH
ncbi:IS5 family transposase [Polaromonas hydrogenivorans]|uniref:IS5 family transposase n=1 Tax=Polaromonas hydrogenivorans TaxID=335476 RepID=A0AAU7LYA9_9BURK